MEPSLIQLLPERISQSLAGLRGLQAEWILAGTLLLVLLLSLLRSPLAGRARRILTGAGLLAATLVVWTLPARPWPGGFLLADPQGSWIQGLVFLTAAAILPGIHRDLRLPRVVEQTRGEFYLLILGVVLGAALLSRTAHIVMAYLGLELISLCSYVLVSFTRREARSAEAGTKFFIYGAFASGFFLYGASWLYGLTGTLDLTNPAFAAGLQEHAEISWLLPAALMLVGLLFKLGAFPFHFWMPDAWEGSTYPVNAILSVVPKGATLVFLMRWWQVMGTVDADGYLRWLLGAIAILSMTWGNLAALRQQHLRRLLAYSGMAHAGFMLMSVTLGPGPGYRAAIFYLSIYMIMNTAAFLMASGFHEGIGHARWQEWTGWGRAYPWGMAVFAVLLASLTGIPPTAGFIAKWYLFLAAIEAGTDPLALALLIAGALNTVLGLAYYLAIPSRMVFRKSAERQPIPGGFPAFALSFGALASILLLVLGVWGFDKILSYFGSWVWNLG